MPANSLKSIALPSMTGMAASGRCRPAQDGSAIADDGDGVAFDGKLPGLARVGAMASHTRATPGV